MGKLGDFLTDEQKKAYIDTNLIPGKVLYLFCKFTSPPKDKYIVLAYSNSKSRPLCFFINSNIRDFLKKRIHLLDCQVKINRSDYSFLDHNSYIDCSNVIYFDKTYVKTQLLTNLNRIKGDLDLKTRNEIISVVDNAKTVSPKHKLLIINALK